MKTRKKEKLLVLFYLREFIGVINFTFIYIQVSYYHREINHKEDKFIIFLHQSQFSSSCPLGKKQMLSIKNDFPSSTISLNGCRCIILKSSRTRNIINDDSYLNELFILMRVGNLILSLHIRGHVYGGHSCWKF